MWNNHSCILCSSMLIEVSLCCQFYLCLSFLFCANIRKLKSVFNVETVVFWLRTWDRFWQRIVAAVRSSFCLFHSIPNHFESISRKVSIFEGFVCACFNFRGNGKNALWIEPSTNSGLKFVLNIFIRFEQQQKMIYSTQDGRRMLLKSISTITGKSSPNKFLETCFVPTFDAFRIKVFTICLERYRNDLCSSALLAHVSITFALNYFTRKFGSIHE